MDAHTMEKHLPLLVPITVFGAYLCTAAPVVYLGDSGEFTAAAFSLGVPHPTGYPLYSFFGKIFCMIPLGNVGFRMNLMSAFFSAITVFLVYDIIRRFTHNVLSSMTAALFLALTPLFWSQTVSAEVYPLHVFFVALMIRLLWQWEKTRTFQNLVLFVFVTGLSFGNHMQTVMLAPPVLYFIISGDTKAIFTVRHFAAISVFFILPLTLYLYLPIRTQAGAAIHWGDPDNLERFLAHISATSYRGPYMFSVDLSQYLSRLVDALNIMAAQYGVLLLLSLWGWVKLPSLRWKVFFVGIILFDLFYTVFLNIISLEITPFTLPSIFVLAIFLGVGLNDLLDRIRQQKKIGSSVKKGFATALCIIPMISLITNYGLCNQSRNYTAYEHAVNIFRTAGHGSTIFLDGDNNVFPVAYGRIVEGMGDGITLHDRHNVLFKWHLETYPFTFAGSWDELEYAVLHKIIRSRSDQGMYFAMTSLSAISLPKDYRSLPCGILKSAVPAASKPHFSEDIWYYYATTSYYDHFFRDHMNRKVTSYYFFRRGESLWYSGRTNEAMRSLKLASKIGYNDDSIHSDLGIFFTDRGLFESAQEELEKALDFCDNPSGIHNNWGYYHHKRGDYEKAITSFEKAIQLEPENHAYYNNLGFTLDRAGQKEKARLVFKKSLSIKEDQPEIIDFIMKYWPDEKYSSD